MSRFRPMVVVFCWSAVQQGFAHPGHPEDEAFYSIIFYALLALAIPLVLFALIDSARKKRAGATAVDAAPEPIQSESTCDKASRSS